MDGGFGVGASRSDLSHGQVHFRQSDPQGGVVGGQAAGFFQLGRGIGRSAALPQAFGIVAPRSAFVGHVRTALASSVSASDC